MICALYADYHPHQMRGLHEDLEAARAAAAARAAEEARRDAEAAEARGALLAEVERGNEVCTPPSADLG